MKSTISLPNFTMRRVQSVVKILAHQNLNFSKDEIIQQCLKKLIRNFPQQSLQRDRLKHYNHRTAHYEIHNVRWTVDFYNTLHFHAYKSRVSVSLMADVAISLYLNYILEMLLCRNGNLASIETNYSAKYEMKKANSWILQENFVMPEWYGFHTPFEAIFLLRLSEFKLM